jgi:predicted phosphodiesterase
VRTLVVADVHSNLAALRAVIADAEIGGAIDRIWCLGDAVGYGPEPNDCIEVLRSYPLTAIAGNHDLAASGLMSTEDFNPYAAEAVVWTGTQLNDDARAWLSSLPNTLIDGDFTLVHGALTDPIWAYLISQRDAERHLKLQKTRYGLVGHSHLPLTFLRLGRGLRGTPIRQ